MTMSEKDRAEMQEAFDRVSHGMPPRAERKKMSPENLALEIAKHQNGSPAYILLSHELDRRIAKDQAIATWQAALLGGLFALGSAALGAWLTIKPSQECVCQWRVETERPQAKLQAPPASAQFPIQSAGKPQPNPAGAHDK
ncbi:MAG: hypothetical protein WC073_12020 [Sterolibacterium sp.]